MRILSFDTTNNCVSIALLESGKVVCERLFVATGSERQESVTLLLPAVDEMLSESGWKKTDLDLLVVGLGPGSFTGIRIGVVTARTLAQALNLPLTGVSLLDCYAAKVAAEAGDLSEFAIVLSGGRGHFYFASYRKDVDGDQETHGAVHTEINADNRATHGAAPAEAAFVEFVPPQHGTLVELKSRLSPVRTWAVEPSLTEALSVECADGGLIELPKLDNIAAFQGILGWRRVSLSKLPSAIFLASSGVSEENGRDVQVKRLRQSLLIDYPYHIVEPLYLRGASVTLKGNDGKATATT
ncbi:MAG: tRNA (adenosine(37)-N6)-threonylcarbamoyltransferase complex dimerization subunit type 1 TsaB [Candidatus Melainabacteria bacterium]|nr:tRNA (adenosine(37)-N6)-threonylcarbamoyltransferase complex dimerization subunit type 1 TsaB [Candidatus Melainabacteria bacterium]